MVKIYFEDKQEKKKCVDVNIWSLVKANFLSSLLLAAIVYGGIVIVGFIIEIALP